MKQLFLLGLSFFFSLCVLAQGGKVIDNRQLNKQILGMERNCAIYLPPDYDTSERSHPVLYLLHATTNDHSGRVQFGEVKHIADKAIANGTGTAMIVVMPDTDTKVLQFISDTFHQHKMVCF